MQFSGGLPYNSLQNSWKNTYGGRVQKVSLHAGFTCPNRDGAKGTGGCTFCNNSAFVPKYLYQHEGLHAQINEGLSFLKRRYNNSKMFVGYFQAYTNTYGNLSDLIRIYDHVLDHPEIDGLVIGTRPDCVSEELLDYFALLKKDHFIHIEYGIESCYDHVLEGINRGHDYATSVWAINETHKRGIDVGAHMLLGLPNETRAMTLAQADLLNELPLNSLKLHQLQIVKGSIMGKAYLQHPQHYNLFGQDEYLDLLVQFIGKLKPEIALDRFFSEMPPKLKIAPNWNGLRAYELQDLLHQKLRDKEVYQGKFYNC